MKITYPFTFEYSPSIEAFLMETPIFLAHRNNQIAGVYRYGEQITIRSPVYLEPYAAMPRRSWLSMGAFSYSQSALSAPSSVGRYCSIAHACAVMGTEHPVDTITTHVMAFRPKWTDDMRARRGGAPTPTREVAGGAGRVTVGNDVWIGQNVLLKSGISIGDGAVIAGGSVVTKDVPPFAIVGGAPAKHIRYRFGKKVCATALRLKWWDYPPEAFEDLPMDQPGEFLNRLEARIQAGKAVPYTPLRINLAAAVTELTDGSQG